MQSTILRLRPAATCCCKAVRWPRLQLDPCRDVQRLHGCERAHLVVRAPGHEVSHGAAVGTPRVRVADVGRKEFQKRSEARSPATAISAGRRAAGAMGTSWFIRSPFPWRRPRPIGTWRRGAPSERRQAHDWCAIGSPARRHHAQGLPRRSGGHVTLSNRQINFRSFPSKCSGQPSGKSGPLLGETTRRRTRARRSHRGGSRIMTVSARGNLRSKVSR